ncbi:phosphatidylinositol phosphatase PTPRQ-like isoform X2 [Anguilla rostrata]|uniref:phosphatidylinositol phosphatase PTPRQ-like isoform X2 n=1 Tax=Anguilla rostrata TaxID=7938 RepID=UPI0030D290E2
MNQNSLMDKTVLLWLISDYLLKVLSLSCSRERGSVEVQVEFGRFPHAQEAELYSLTCSSTGSQTLWLNATDSSGCVPDCRVVLHEPLEAEMYNVDIKAIKNNVILETKSFRVDPKPSSSLSVGAMVSSAYFSWGSGAGEPSTSSLRLRGRVWDVPPDRTSYRVTGLQPASLHNFTVEFKTGVRSLNVTLTRRLSVLLQTALCPVGWVPSESSCWRAWRRGRPWVEAGLACNASGSHLADIETEEDFLFISSYLSTLNNMMLVWTGLNDLQQEGQLQWSNGAAYSLSSTVTSSLPANQTDCFALHMNATSPSYFFTGFFCYMPLPYMCQYTFPPAPPHFALVLERVWETEALIGWSDVEDWRQAGGALELFLQYQEDAFVDQPHRRTVLSNSRSAAVRDLSPGRVYLFSLRAKHLSGAVQTLGSVLRVLTIPAVPEDLTLIQHNEDSMLLTWRPPQGQVEGYQLSYGASAAQITQRKLSTTDCSVRLEQLTPGAEYQLTLQSFRGTETSEPVSTRILIPPARVCFLSLTHVNSSSVGLAWEPALGLFDQYRLTVANGSTVQELLLPRESLSHTVSSLQDGCTYNLTMYRVRSTVTGATAVRTVTTVPARPQGLRVSSVSSHGFSLRWDGPSGCVDRYHVHLNPAHGLVTVRRAENGEIQAVVLAVTPGISYSTTVTAVAASVFSSPVSRTVTTNESTPESPTSLIGERVGSTGILLSWTAPIKSNGKIRDYAIKYKEVCPYPESSFNQIVTPSEIPEYLLNTLTPGSTYNIKVAAKNGAGFGLFSKSLFFKTAEAPPGLVTNLTAFAANHSVVKVTWFLPKLINGLITKFSVKAKYARTGVTVRKLEVNAEDIMNGALPHCNDAAEILSRGTPSPSEMSMQTSASSPPVTLSAVPPAASWNIPISAVVDQLRSYTAYVFEVSAFTSDGEGQIASYMVRMPESAPEDPPQNLSAWNITSKSFSLSWDPPTIVTGRFSYVIELHGPTGYLYENSTTDLKLVYSGLNPYTHYRVLARAKSAGALGPEAEAVMLTPAEAPSAVTELVARAVDATSVQVSWRSPSQPNGLITQYKLLVLVKGAVIRNITLIEQKEGLNQTHSDDDGVLNRRVRDATALLLHRYQRAALFPTSAPPPVVTSAYFLFASRIANQPGTATERSAHPTAASPFTSALLPSPAPESTSLPWLTDSAPPTPHTTLDLQTPGSAALTLPSDPSPTGGDKDPPPLSSSPAQPRLSTRAAVTADVTTSTAMVSSTQVIDFSADRISYVVTNLSPFTEYTFSVSAFTTVGEGPLVQTKAKTREQVPSSVQSVSYLNISSSSILLSWEPPLNPNGKITHYTAYVLDLDTKEAFQRVTNSTSIILLGLKKYSSYKLRVAASTAVGESALSEADDVFAVTLEDEPDSPPVNLSVYNVSTSSATVTWSPPVLANGVIRFYQILYQNSTMSLVVNSTSPSVSLEGLKPFSFYNVTVRAFTKYGHGNQSSEVLDLLSGEDVPGSPPFDLMYESLSSSEVNVSWQAPLVPNGAILFYSVEYWNSTHALNTTTPTTYVRLSNLRKYARYRASVRASTRLGSGNHTSDILNITTLEDVPEGPIHNLTAQNFTSTALIVSWDPPLAPNGRVFYHLSLEEEHKTLLSSNQTIRKTTNDLVFLFTKLRKYTDYILKVTPATSAGSSENSTSVLYLRTEDDVPSSPPLFSSSRNVSSSSIHLSWLPPLEPNGVLTEYSLVLQGPGGANTTLTPDTSLTLTGLLPFSPYNVSIAAGNRRGLGPSLILLLHTDEAGPASPPRNLTVYNHTAASVWLTWEASLEPNGLVKFYGFRILELRRQTLTFQNSSGPSTWAQLTGFRPHSVYQISVCTFTRAGNGDQYSDSVTFTTNQSVSEAVRNLSCSGWSWDSVFLEWEAPAQSNGELTHYLIRYGEEEEELGPHTLWHTLSGLQPHTHYTFLVMAVNSAGPGDRLSCNASTPPESVPGPPGYFNVTQVQPTSVSLSWDPPESVPGQLQGYRIRVQLLSLRCGAWGLPACVEMEVLVYANTSTETEITLEPLRKYRQYRFSISARTNAGYGNASRWVTTRTLPGDPDDPPRSVSVMTSSSGMKIEWEEPEQLAGPTSYLIYIVSVDGPDFNQTLVTAPEEKRVVVMSNLTAYTLYQVTVVAFRGPEDTAWQRGKASEPVFIRTLEEQPRDPPKNVTLQVIPEEVTRVYVTFSPPTKPNGNISGYQVRIYRDDQLDFQIHNLPIVHTQNQTMTGIIKGLKGGYNYRILISAVNGAGSGPSSEVHITTGIKAPPKPTQTPEAATDKHGVVMATSRTITILMPMCFFSDANGPIQKVQVIVAEEWVMDDGNLTNWKNAFNHRPAPYFTDEGFPNPVCFESGARRVPNVDTYVIGEDDSCMAQEKDGALCNGPLKPRTHYVFKFRAVNVQGQYTDSDFSERIRTSDSRNLTRDEEIILGVLLSFFLAVLLILIIYASVRIHQKQKEGGTYSPREAEIIETKFKLDQLIAVADLELKEEKLNRYSSFFFRRKEIFVIQPVNKKSFLQHVEDLCANDNIKFQEEFSELPKLLHDLATSDADLPWNRSKNRFTNIKPYNNNRVKLLSEPGVPGSDYINASFVSGYLCPNEFIATQGPLPGTVADFWRMIWETRSRTIAMLTQCFEKGRIRCHQYWPEDNKPVTVFGDIVITKLSEDVFPDWTVRVLKVERHGDYMVVNHFNFTSWPEHGVPESSTTLIQFVRTIRAHRGHDNTTMVVHCSAGVGRTGVFIALDHLVQHVSDHDFVDIYGLVAELRSERMCMVQNLAQYMFLHQSTLDLLNSKGNSQSVWFVSYSALEKMDSLDAMEGDVELEWEETTM